MDFGLFINSLPLPGVMLLSLTLALVSVEAGSWLARFRASRAPTEPEGPVSAMVGAILGLLAFILAITFSMTADRYDTRKQLVIDDANAVAGAYFKAGFLPAPQRDACRKLLREYVGLRAQIAPTRDINELIARCEEIQNLLAEQAQSLTSVDMDSDLRAMFIDAIHELTSVHLSRKTVAMVYRIPGTIWASLYVLSALSMVAIGYQVGASGVRRLWGTPLLAAAFSLVIVMIADMDRPMGQFAISQQPMLDVRNTIERAP